jgi:hypothetical protein
MDDVRLINALFDNIDYDEYKLEDDMKKWIYKFINDYRKIFIELDTDLRVFMQDRKIELDNVPTIIKIITDTYYSDYCKDKHFNVNNLCIFIKYTIYVILDTELLVLPSNTSRESLINIVDSSMDLLNMNINIANDFNDGNNRYNKKFNNCCNCLFELIRLLRKK